MSYLRRPEAPCPLRHRPGADAPLLSRAGGRACLRRLDAAWHRSSTRPSSARRPGNRRSRPTPCASACSSSAIRCDSLTSRPRSSRRRARRPAPAGGRAARRLRRVPRRGDELADRPSSAWSRRHYATNSASRTLSARSRSPATTRPATHATSRRASTGPISSTPRIPTAKASRCRSAPRSATSTRCGRSTLRAGSCTTSRPSSVGSSPGTPPAGSTTRPATC